MVVGACNPAPSQPAEPAHEKHLTPRLIAQRIMYCDAGSRADVDFIDAGLKMAVTWLPKGRTEILHAPRTGEEFRNRKSTSLNSSPKCATRMPSSAGKNTAIPKPNNY